jgi:sugar phosphate isomerase/epimerase
MEIPKIDRRDLLKICGVFSSGGWLLRLTGDAGRDYRRRQPLPFKISVSQRSLRNTLSSGELEHLEFARFARQELDINAVDYASSYFREYVEDQDFLNRMNQRAADEGVRNVLLLVEGEGNLMAADEAVRQQAIGRHQLWIDAAVKLGCRGVRVQLEGENPAPEPFSRALESIKVLAGYGAERKIHLLIGNEAGIARDPAWLKRLINSVDSQRLGAFAYFLPRPEVAAAQDPYKTMADLMPVTRGVCATSREFDENGQEKNVDFTRMLEQVIRSGYGGYISAEFQFPPIEAPAPEGTRDEDREQNREQDRNEDREQVEVRRVVETGEQTEQADQDGKVENREGAQVKPLVRSIPPKFEPVNSRSRLELDGIKATLKLLKTLQEVPTEKFPE